MSYTAPLKDMLFVINELAGLDAVAALYNESATGEGVRLTYVTECFRAQRRDG